MKVGMAPPPVTSNKPLSKFHFPSSQFYCRAEHRVLISNPGEETPNTAAHCVLASELPRKTQHHRAVDGTRLYEE